MADEWNLAVPPAHSLLSDYPGHDVAIKTNTKAIIEKEHEDLGEGNSGGQHSSGSAVAFEGTSAPTARPDGTSLADNAIDRGRLYLDDNYNPPILKRWDGSALEIVAKSKITVGTDDEVLDAGDLVGNQVYTNDGHSAECNIVLPETPVAGQKVSFLVTDAYALKVTAGTGKKFRYFDTQGDAAGYIQSNVVGTFWTVVYSADDWVIIHLLGNLAYDQAL